VHALQFLQKQRTILRHIGIFPCKTGRAHSRRAIERVNFQSRVIGDNPSVVTLCGRQRFECGVLCKSCACFLDLGQIGTSGQVLHQKTVPENLPHLASFVRIARGQQQALL